MLGSMNIGGVEKSLLSLLSVIPKDKFKITLLLLEKKGGFLTEVPEWVEVIEATWYKETKPVIMQPPQKTIKNFVFNKHYLRIPTFICSYFFSKYFDNRYLYYKEVLKKVPMHENEFDIAIAYQGPTDVIDFYIANKVKAQKKISWVHFDVSKHLVNVKLYKKLYSKYDKLFVVSNDAKQKLIEKVPSTKDKAIVFKNIISKKLIRMMAHKAVPFDDNYKGLRIVTVGRLSKEKGQDVAIKVLAKLRHEGYEIRWYCVGDGKAREEFEALIAKYRLEGEFILLGATTNPYPYILNADIYIQTSRHEGYCLTLAEAKCLNKPIITTNFTGASEQLLDGYNGYIVNYCEKGIGLYEGIKSLINDPEKSQNLTKNLIRINKLEENHHKEILDI